jgi:hypothetical protein
MGDAEHEREHDQVPDSDVPGPREPREHQGLQQHDRLRDGALAGDVVSDTPVTCQTPVFRRCRRA